MVNKLNNKFNCDACKDYDFHNIVQEAIVYTNGIMKKDPTMRNITNNISNAVLKDKQHLDCGHLKQLVDFVVDKCIVSAVKNLKRGVEIQMKKGKKPVAVSHYKLKIMK